MPESIQFIQTELDRMGKANRSRLAMTLCSHFHFFDPLGKPQVSGCLKALRQLEKNGDFLLPAAYLSSSGKPDQRHKPPRPARVPGQCRLDKPVEPPSPLPTDAGQIEQLELVLVELVDDRRIWNELMIREHPQGKNVLVGRQLRYLVKSEHGWLGGIGFSSAALNLEARDHWIGWTWETRQELLHYVVGMSRFLIRDGVVCKNLASRVLGLVVRTVGRDFEKRYGYHPLLLESFVDTSLYLGTCYKAANWQWLGVSKGRGRQDRLKQSPKSIKDIYIYPLVEDFRRQLGFKKDAGLGALALEDALASEDWAEQEFGGAPLGDKRHGRRLVEIGSDIFRNPGCSYGQASNGTWPKVKAYDRMIDQPDDSPISMATICASHRKQTLRRMAAESIVLAVQDGTDLSYSGLSACKGLGQIGKNQTKASTSGLHLHSTLALTSTGLPLGVLRAQCTARQFNANDDLKPKKTARREEKLHLDRRVARLRRHQKTDAPHENRVGDGSGSRFL